MAVYLLHFNQPIGHARHYTGYSSERSCERRLAAHASGRGARLPQVALERGISWTVAQIWPEGDRELEREIKRRGQAARCPLCWERYRAEARARDQRYRARKKLARQG